MNQHSDFYDEIGFFSALFYNKMLDNRDIYYIAKILNNKISDDVFTEIIENGEENNNNKKLFGKYLRVHGIKYIDPKRALIAKIFYYILTDRIDFYKGIKFAHRNVSDFKKTKTYVGDDVDISQILGAFYMIDDGDLSNEKGIETAIELIIMDLKQYINVNLANFPIDNNISKNNEKTLMDIEIEKKVKLNAFEKGMQVKNYSDELREVSIKQEKRIISEDEYKMEIHKIYKKYAKIYDAIDKNELTVSNDFYNRLLDMINRRKCNR